MTSPNSPESQPARQPVTGRRRSFVIWFDKMFLGFARRWALWLSLIAGIYTGLPIFAPVAMHAGWTGVGRTIYTLYSPVCHQFAFRSWFLFGEQTIYPRERAGVEGVRPFEEYAVAEPYFDGIDPYVLDNDLTLAAKSFIGSERMGWKVGFCERDVSIYMAIALFGIAFAVLKRFGVNVPPLPFWAYLLIAIVPIGLDGFSQLFANPPFNGFGLGFYPDRESTPFLRALTGGMFGLGNAWLAFPYIEESMAETRLMLAQKLTRAGVIKGQAAVPTESA